MNNQEREILQGVLQRLLQEPSRSTPSALPPSGALQSSSPSIVSNASLYPIDGDYSGAADERRRNDEWICVPDQHYRPSEGTSKPVDPAHDAERHTSLISSSLTEEADIHERYNFADASVTFKVESTLFRVHRFFFERDSVFFRNLFNVSSDKAAVELHDYTALDFERFLGVLYPPAFDRHAATSLAEWTSILRLASQWGFESVRLLAEREVLPLASAVDKIVLGHKHNIMDWLGDAYVELCARRESLSDEEAELIGARDTARVARIREKMIGGVVMGPGELRRLVEAQFQLVDEGSKREGLEDEAGNNVEYGDGKNMRDEDVKITGCMTDTEDAKIDPAAQIKFMRRCEEPPSEPGSRYTSETGDGDPWAIAPAASREDKRRDSLKEFFRSASARRRQ